MTIGSMDHVYFLRCGVRYMVKGYLFFGRGEVLYWRGKFCIDTGLWLTLRSEHTHTAPALLRQSFATGSLEW